jgi:hypothetical protein
MWCFAHVSITSLTFKDHGRDIFAKSVIALGASDQVPLYRFQQRFAAVWTGIRAAHIPLRTRNNRAKQVAQIKIGNQQALVGGSAVPTVVGCEEMGVSAHCDISLSAPYPTHIANQFMRRH